MTESYQEYLDSPEWQAKRLQRIVIGGKRCAACHSSKNLHVHHLTYARIFNEEMYDLMPLCDVCHEYVERKFKEGKIRKDIHPLLAATETMKLLVEWICKCKEKSQAVFPSKLPLPKPSDPPAGLIGQIETRNAIQQKLLLDKNFCHVIGTMGRRQFKTYCKNVFKGPTQKSNAFVLYDRLTEIMKKNGLSPSNRRI